MKLVFALALSGIGGALRAWFLLALFAAPAFGNRCVWNPIENRPRCCSSREQAVWDPRSHRVRCPPSESGGSCLFHPYWNRVECCGTEQHGVWNPVSNRLECFSLSR